MAGENQDNCRTTSEYRPFHGTINMAIKQQNAKRSML